MLRYNWGPFIIYVITLGYLVGQKNANLDSRSYLVKFGYSEKATKLEKIYATQ